MQKYNLQQKSNTIQSINVAAKGVIGIEMISSLKVGWIMFKPAEPPLGNAQESRPEADRFH